MGLAEELKALQELRDKRVSGALFLLHPESESPAVFVLVNSRLAANL
jgi:hypothetical protein